MTKMNCKTCNTYLPDLLLDPQAVPAEVSTHVTQCAVCGSELKELRATLSAMDAWTAPEPSAYFDARLHARLRAAQAAPPESLWERLTSFLQFSTGRELRPALAGALGLAMLLGGGTAATVLLHHGTGTAASPTVNDLRIFDNNAQAVQQMDLLDEPGSAPEGAPQS